MCARWVKIMMGKSTERTDPSLWELTDSRSRVGKTAWD